MTILVVCLPSEEELDEILSHVSSSDIHTLNKMREDEILINWNAMSNSIT